MYFTYVFSTNGRVFQKFLQKVLARDLKIPIMHRTQRRTVVKFLSFQVRRYFCSLTMYQTICVGTC